MNDFLTKQISVRSARMATYCMKHEHPKNFFLISRPIAVEDIGCVYSDFCMLQLQHNEASIPSVVRLLCPVRLAPCVRFRMHEMTRQ